jgi:hypothetical protein
MLLDRTLSLLRDSCGRTFAQERSQTRAVELGLGTLCALGRRTLSRSICAVGRQFQDWSADYKVFSRSPWDADDLFAPVIVDYMARYPRAPVCAALDDTNLARSGRKVKTAFWQRDPLSPPFHVNLLYGLRFMQVSLLFPHYREGGFSARGIPVRFVECPAVKKPGKRADAAQWRAYRQAAKVYNLSTQSLAIIRELRAAVDALEGAGRPLLLAVDGSLCNRTIFRAELDRVELVGRCRKDARLCLPAPAGARRRYAQQTFTPEAVRKDPKVRWRTVRIYFGGKKRKVRYKEVPDVLWRRGAGQRRLRLFVLAPQPYKTSVHSRTNYHAPAYLLATAPYFAAKLLLQCYFDRWQIEVNHRDEKDILGVGQAQVWSTKSVPRQPAFAVACYSLILLAALQEFGPGRTDDFVPLPKWRKKATRPSALDLITLLRKEIDETPGFCGPIQKISQNLLSYAYT